MYYQLFQYSLINFIAILIAWILDSPNPDKFGFASLILIPALLYYLFNFICAIVFAFAKKFKIVAGIMINLIIIQLIHTTGPNFKVTLGYSIVVSLLLAGFSIKEFRSASS